MSAAVTMVQAWRTRLLAHPLPPRERAWLEIALGVVLTTAAMVGLSRAVAPDPSRLAHTALPAGAANTAAPVREEPPNHPSPAFIAAVRTGDLHGMKASYVAGTPVQGMLSLAASDGHNDAAGWLLLHGASIHEDEGTIDAPILLADAHPDTVRLLLARGASDPPLWLAARAGAAHTIDRLLTGTPGLGGAPVNPRGASPLYEALTSPRLAPGPKRLVVERFLAAGADPEHHAAGFNALAAAVGNCSGASEPGPAADFCMPVIGMLLERGARVRGDALAAALDLETPERDEVLTVLLQQKLEPGATAVALAHTGAPKDVVKLLVAKGIDWAWHDGEEDAALPVMAAVRRQDRDGLRELLDAGAPADRRYKDATCALGVAIDGSDGRTVELLVARGAGVNRRLPDGRTPLFAAAEIGDLRIVNFLIDSGARPNEVVLDDTPLNIAEQQGNTSVARVLHARGGYRAHPFDR